MEGRLGHDFGEVRVHTDRRAAASARDLHALAYTVGQDVVFGAGRYAPATPEGRRLLAHELVHVVQQGGRPPAPLASLTVGSAQDPAETEAERVADRVVAGAVGPAIGSYGVAIQRQTAPEGTSTGAQQVPAAPSGATQQHPGCERRTTRVGDPAAIIEEAKATAITWTNSVIPMVGAAIAAPGSWRGTIASELLDRHFHCPSVEQLDYIRTTMQLIAALLPRLQLHCDTAFNRLCVGDNVWGSMDDDPFTPILCPGYFRVSENRRARVLIQIQAWLLGRVKECFPRDPCYDDFSLPASNMVANRTSYGYFTAEAVGAENHPRPLNIPCPSRQPPEPSQPEPEPTRACYEAGRLTGRIVVFPDPPARPHVQVGSGSATGRLLDERSDASGNFVCDRGRRVGQVW